MEPEERLAKHASTCRWDDLPVPARDAALRSLIDTTGAMVAGSTAEGVNQMLAVAGDVHSACGTLLPAGLGRLIDVEAAWCVGAMTRARELDDCVDDLPAHPSASVFPALYALANGARAISGRRFLTALAVGQDVKLRLARSMHLNAMQSGRNNPFKIYAATAATANLLGLSVAHTHHALGLASSFAVGDGQCAIEGTMGLRVQYGNVARGALICAMLASRDVTGPRRFLTGPFGYFAAFEPRSNVDVLTADLGSRFAGVDISVKPYAACRATHAAIELASDLHRSFGASFDAVADVRFATVRVTPEVETLVGGSNPSARTPTTATAAQFSLPYAMATALRFGRFGLDDSGPSAVACAETTRLMERCASCADPTHRTETALGRATLKVTLRDGSAHVRTCSAPLGNPKRPVDRGTERAKLIDCLRFAGLADPVVRAERLTEIAHSVADLPDIRTLFQEIA